MITLEQIQALDPALVASRDDGAIAAALSVGRIKVVQKLGGIGLVLETLGPEGGATLLDALQGQTATVPALKWAWYLIERGELDFGSAATRGMINALITEPAKSLLLAVAEVADPVSSAQIEVAMKDETGAYK